VILRENKHSRKERGGRKEKQKRAFLFVILRENKHSRKERRGRKEK